MKTIIAATDFSENSRNAVWYAAALAKATKARLVLFNHFDFPLPATDLPGMVPVYVDELAQLAEARLKELKEEITGTAEIREVFKVSKVGTVAGCMITDGTINRKDPIRLIRDGIVIFSGHLESLKRFKDDAREVHRGFECGMQIHHYNDIQERDVVEQYRTTEVQRKLK